MIRKLGAFAVIGLAAAGCASQRPAALGASTPAVPGAGYTGYRCAPGDACAPKDKSPHRQYYDAHHRRYYYYDPQARRYFWEDGKPKV